MPVAKLTRALVNADLREQSRGRGWGQNEVILLVDASPMNNASHNANICMHMYQLFFKTLGKYFYEISLVLLE